jgi:hypothetical protein
MLLVLRFHVIAAPSRSPMKTSSPCSTTHEIPSRSSDLQTSRLDRRTQSIAPKTAPRSEDAYLSARKIGSFMVPRTFQSFFCDALRLSSSGRLGSPFCCLPPSSRSSSPEWLLPSTSTSIWNRLPVVVFIR